VTFFTSSNQFNNYLAYSEAVLGDFSFCFSLSFMNLCVFYLLVDPMATRSEFISSFSTLNSPMTSINFNGKNYIYWARSVEIFLRGQGLSDHLSSNTPKSSSITTAFARDMTSSDSSTTSITSAILEGLWDWEDNLIMSPMISSIDPSIGITLIDL
jgi:hypothetical protein